jgi:4-amino-4-deoxy-L-arabinose transferase-like glycosyltransferase
MFHELWTPDEPMNAAAGRAMWTYGSWVTPRLNGELFLEKPPLNWWAQTIVFAAFDQATPPLPERALESTKRDVDEVKAARARS